MITNYSHPYPKLKFTPENFTSKLMSSLRFGARGLMDIDSVSPVLNAYTKGQSDKNTKRQKESFIL